MRFSLKRQPVPLSAGRLPRLRFTARDRDGRAVRLPAPDSRLLLFVRSRCLASHELTAMLASHRAAEPPGFAVTPVVVDDPVSARRFSAGVPPGLTVAWARASRLPRPLRSSLPSAVAVGPGGQVRHAGKMGGPTEVVRFAEACGDYELRRWCKDAFMRRARSRAQAPIDSSSSWSAVTADAGRPQQPRVG